MHDYQQIVLLSMIGIAVVTDLLASRVPNWLTLPAIATGLLIHTGQDGISGLMFSIQGLTVGFGIFLLVFLMKGMGGGDVKLMAAIGSFIGPHGIMASSIVIGLLGGLYGFAMMVMNSGVRVTVQRFGTMMKTFVLTKSLAASLEPRGQQPHLRYALVIGLGTLLSQWGADILPAHH